MRAAFMRYIYIHKLVRDMAKRNRRYSDYRRPRRRGNAALEIIIILLLLILIAFLVFSFVLGGKIEYTDEGLHVVLPESWLGQSEPPESPVVEETPTPPLVVEDEEPSPEPSEEPSPEPSPEPDPLPVAIVAVEVSVEQLLDGTAAQNVRDAGGNALVVNMKPVAGVLPWSAEDRAVVDAVASLQEEDLYLVARVCCFRDNALASARMGGPLSTPSGKVWYDYFGHRWVSPASEEVRSYLVELCLELTSMGFDELLLEFAGYPYFGETHVLGTNELRPEDLSAPVSQFWGELHTALEGTGVQLSAIVTASMVAGTEELSGIGPELLALYADRVWVKPSAETDYIAALEGAGMEDAAARLVLIGGTEEEGFSLAVISKTIG